MMAIKAVAAVVVLTGLSVGGARANCARDVVDAKAKVQQIKDEKTRERANDYLQRATRELDENDEFECETAIEAIDKMSKPPVTK